MTKSFLLRFQEPCEESSPRVGATGTETRTKITREQSDKDSAMAAPQFLPVAMSSVGTDTHTRVRNEQADTDPGMTPKMLPPQYILGTRTKTAVKTETADQDQQSQKLRTLPKCSLF